MTTPGNIHIVVGVADAPPNWREARTHSTGIFASCGHILLTHQQIYHGTVCKDFAPSFLGAVSTNSLQWQVIRGSHAQYLFLAAFAATRIQKLVTQARFNS